MSKRADALGFFWQDIAIVKPPKAEKPKRTPPERTWEADDYLPGLEEARLFPIELMSDIDIAIAYQARERLVFDIECYWNYFLIAFMSVESGKVFYFELYDGCELNTAKLQWVLDKFTVVSFHGRNYDVPITSMALAGKPTTQLKAATNQIITEELRPYVVLRKHKVKSISPDHIDLIELAPLHQSLKSCAGRLHIEQMQDLPFHHEKLLNEDQRTITRWYCVKDLKSTRRLYEALKPEIDLREQMGERYGLDLRSKSDAQIAESVLTEELRKLNGVRPQHPTIAPGTTYFYQVPQFLQYRSGLMNWALELVRTTPFIVGEEGSVGMPPQLSDLKINIADGVYRMGIGGLHSSEKRTTHVSDADTILCDRDVISFYPRIILNLGLYPRHLGVNFLIAYDRIVEERLAAKAAGNKLVAESLKIVINGSYGKLGSPYSVLYSPDLLIQVTLTGQLSLLLLIESLVLAGISVVSANTDGIVLKYKKHQSDLVLAVVKQWEKDTGFETEETLYKGLYSRDVNNYVAVKLDGKMKTKGAYGEANIDKNCAGQICMDAVLGLLSHGKPIADHINECPDIRKFVFVRTVNGGAVKDGKYLGKAVRWYYAKDENGEIIYARSGNKVPGTDGARPCMNLPTGFPEDMDFNWYIRKAEKILIEIGYASA